MDTLSDAELQQINGRTPFSATQGRHTFGTASAEMGSMQPTSAAQWIDQNWKRLVVAPEDLDRWTTKDDDALRVAGVYFLWSGDTGLNYIGHSGDVLYRMVQHKWSRRIPFDTFSVIEIDPNPFEYGLCAPTLEKSYIEALEPPYNILRTGTGIRKMVKAIRKLWVPIESTT